MAKPLAGSTASTARAISTLPQLRRLLWAVGRLRAGRPLKATDLASEFEVNVRTAYRDLDFLRDDWRVPLEFDRAQSTYRLTEPTVALPSVTLSEGELVALYFAERVLAQYRGTPFEADLASAFRKIQDLLPGEVRVSPASLDDFLSLDPGPLHTPDAEVFRDVLAALRLRRRLLVRYRSLSSNRTAPRTLHPYHLFNHRGDWYVAGWDEARKRRGPRKRVGPRLTRSRAMLTLDIRSGSVAQAAVLGNLGGQPKVPFRTRGRESAPGSRDVAPAA
jgi:proteasome accessory factor B